MSQDIWIFAYGSLIWNPGFAYLEQRPARLRGWHRAFCIYSYRYRGTPEKPGLVLGLDRGGSCRGVAFRIEAAESTGVLATLDARELVTGVYQRRALTVETPGVKLANGQAAIDPITAWGYVTDRKHQQYAGKLDLAEKARLIVQGIGPTGATNVEYLENTACHLAEFGIQDPYLERLRLKVSELTGR